MRDSLRLKLRYHPARGRTPGHRAQDDPIPHDPCELESAGGPGPNPHLSTP